MASPWFRIGAVRTLNPAKREVRVTADPPQAHQFDGVEWVGFRTGREPVIRCRVESVTRRGENVTLALSAGVTRDTVASLKGAEVVIEGSARKPRPEGGWHVSELAGLAVLGPDGVVLGTVREVIETGANDVMEIARPGGGTLLLPVIEQLVESVDLEAGRIRVGDIRPYAVDHED